MKILMLEILAFVAGVCAYTLICYVAGYGAGFEAGGRLLSFAMGGK